MNSTSDSKQSLKVLSKLVLTSAQVAHEAEVKPTVQEIKEAEAMELAKQKLAERQEAQDRYAAMCITYEKFTELVRCKYRELDSGWYRVAPNSVLPPERCVVKLKHTTRSGAAQGYWFMPQGYLCSDAPFEVWRDRVRWKSLNGYGVEAIAWHNDVDAAGIKEVYYEQ